MRDQRHDAATGIGRRGFEPHGVADCFRRSHRLDGLDKSFRGFNRLRAEIRNGFDVAACISTAAAGVLLSTAGWIMAFASTPRRGILGGGFVGVGVLLVYFLNALLWPIGQILFLDLRLLVPAVAIALSFSMVAGWLMQLDAASPLALPTAATLAFGMMLSHFLATAGTTIAPDGDPVAVMGNFDRQSMMTAVVAASIAIIGAALILSFHSQILARATGRDKRVMAAALAALRFSEAHHRASVELSPQIPWVADADGNVIEIAPRWGELVGLPPDRALGTGWAEAVHPEDLPRVQQLWQAVTENNEEQGADTRYRVRLKDGTYCWFRAVARPRRTATGEIIAWYGSLEDIHKQVNAELALRESEERYRLASRATNDVIWDWSAETNCIAWAGAFAEMFGYPDPGEATPLVWWLERVHADDRDRVWSAQVSSIADDHCDQWDHEYRFRTASGEFIHVYSRGHILRDDTGRTSRAVGSIMDITTHKRREHDLQWTAHHDPLTKLPNRALYAQRLDAAIAWSRQHGGCVSLVVVDLNNFKMLNDSYGHSVGDAALREVANRLSAAVPTEGTVARLGGDEFAIILPALAICDQGAGAVHAVLSALSKPFTAEGRQVDLTLSGGAAIWPLHAENAEDLLRSADLALYAAKADGIGATLIFKPEMRHAAEHRQQMLAVAKTALEHCRVVPFYQAKVCLRTGRIEGFEALLRWHDEDGILKGPAEIAAAFEDGEISVQLTDHIMDGIVRHCVEWEAQGVPYGRIAFNVTSSDFRRGNLAERVLEKVRTAGLCPTKLEIEVTETVFLGRLGTRVDGALSKLRAAGVTVALDDFGTGYASLTHLQQFHVDVLKIDRSFVARLPDDTGSGAAIVNAVLGLAQSLGIKTVAEGVETVEQAEYLCARGCDAGQGYLFSRAVEAHRVPELLARSPSPSRVSSGT